MSGITQSKSPSKKEMFTFTNKQTGTTVSTPKRQLLSSISRMNTNLQISQKDKNIVATQKNATLSITDTKHDLCITKTKQEMLDDIVRVKHHQQTPTISKVPIEIREHNGKVTLTDTSTGISITTSKVKLVKKFGTSWKIDIQKLGYWILSWYVDYATAMFRLFLIDPFVQLNFATRHVEFHKTLFDLRDKRYIMKEIMRLKEKEDSITKKK
jgi:putative transposon-encoded protein